MYCPKCGAQNSDSVSFCTQCGASLQSTFQTGFQRPQFQSPSYSSPPKTELPPDNKLVKAILVTIFCCLPFGIISIINAAQVNSKWAAGDYEGARRSAFEADKWANIGLWVGIAVYLIYAILLLIGVGLEGKNI
ncbi:MAG: CD225/dispanin family protein [bacterium]|nr:CD225/dispanin family protein [bacterium]